MIAIVKGVRVANKHLLKLKTKGASVNLHSNPLHIPVKFVPFPLRQIQWLPAFVKESLVPIIRNRSSSIR